MSTTQDHRVDISESARFHTQYALEAQQDDTFWTEFLLDAELFQSKTCDERYRVEFLLTCGGPTVRVIVDQYDHATFEHSWGKNPHTDEEMQEWRMHSDDEQFWLDRAQEYKDMQA